MNFSYRTALYLTVGMSGCANPVANTHAAIVGGTNSSTDEAVVLVMSIFPSGAAAFGTGTLIAPDLVLTARHSVQDNPAGAVADCSLILPSPANRENRIYIGPSFQRSELQSQPGIAATPLVPPGDYTLCNGDLALLRLASPADVTPAALNTELFVAAEPIVVVGYGRTNPAVAPNPRIRMQGVGFVRAQGDPLVEIQARACHGDSGGPIFDARGYLQGVLGFTRSNDCVISGGLPTAAFRAWLRANIAESYMRHPARPQPAPRSVNGGGPPDAQDAGVADIGADAGGMVPTGSEDASTSPTGPPSNPPTGGGCQTQRARPSYVPILLCLFGLVWALRRRALP